MADETREDTSKEASCEQGEPTQNVVGYPHNFLGKKAMDTVTKFTGTITQVCVTLLSTDQAYVESSTLQDGKPVGEWISVGRIEILTE